MEKMGFPRLCPITSMVLEIIVFGFPDVGRLRFTSIVIRDCDVNSWKQNVITEMNIYWDEQIRERCEQHERGQTVVIKIRLYTRRWKE